MSFDRGILKNQEAKNLLYPKHIWHFPSYADKLPFWQASYHEDNKKLWPKWGIKLDYIKL